MFIKSEDDILTIIKQDNWMMDMLKTVHTLQTLQLPDWWICAGFVRSKIWDVLHNFEERTSLPDVDVIYYDATNINKEREKDLEKQLIAVHPFIPWSVKNQARMHFANGVAPYASSKDAISKFPETATALGVKLDENDNLLLTAPYGIQDVVNLKGKPTPYFQQFTKRMKIYQDRIQHKQWHLIWYRIQYE